MIDFRTKLGYNVISIRVAMLTEHCVIGRHAERMQLQLKTSAVEEETFIPFLCQCPSLARCNPCQLDGAVLH